MRAIGVLPEPTPEQPRDEAGRFAEPSRGGFDGGARQPVPLPSDPVADHNAFIAELVRARQVQRSPGGWTIEQ
jgi:hypothetical protein